MSAAVRGEGLLVAVGFPVAVVVAVGVWLSLHDGATLKTGIAASLVLIVFTALADRIEVVVSPRTSSSAAAGFVVASAFVGGPLIGACAGAALEVLDTGAIWRVRFAWGGAGALEGFLVGLLGEQLAVRGTVGALTAAALGLSVGFVFNLLAMLIVSLDRAGKLRSQLRSAWRPVTLGWVLPWPPLAAFLFSYGRGRSVALALAAGLLLALWLGNRARLRLEKSLDEERLRSRRDALTSAPNRYALAEALASEQARIMRGGRTAALCFLDLDRFKTVNDAFGYAAGDQLLVDVYQRLREQLRSSDQVFRWGGEEFVVLAPQVERQELEDFAERLRLLVAARPFSIEGRPRTVTGSVGAVLLEESPPAEVALEAAGGLVRRAKLTRNTVVADTPSPRSAATANSAAAG